jgi:tetratricopeptide (TPR) repeat protein
LSIFALHRGDVAQAKALSERSLELHRRLANDKGAAQPLALLGAIALRSGDRERGQALLEESAELARKIRWRWWRAGTLSALAEVAIADDRIADAQGLLHEAVDLALDFGDRVGLSWYLSQYALTLLHDSRTSDAGRIWGAVETAAAFIPGGPWPRDLERLRREVLAFADVAFETGHEAGRSLSLEEAAAWMCGLD